MTVIALQIRHVGTIEESLFAPTSLNVGVDNLAVLEPYSKQLKIFTPDGVIQRSVNINGESNGLCRYSENIYLFCDRIDKKIVAVDIADRTQYNFFENIFAFSNPTDIIIVNDKIHVIDSELKMIITFDRNLIQQNSIVIIDNSGNQINFAGSFGYNPVNKQYYIFDQVNSTIWVLNDEGQFIKTFGSFGAGYGQISRGGELILNNNGYVFISDRYQNRISIFSQDGEFIENIDVVDSLRASLRIPTGMAIDENGLLYVASTESSKIQIFFIEKVASQQTISSAEQLYPFDSDTVRVDYLKFVAIAKSIAGGKEIAGFDFQLFYEFELEIPIKESALIPPVLAYDSSKSIGYYTGEWTLYEPLEADHIYHWRTRTRFSDTLGVWTDFRKFVTTPLPIQFELKQNYPNPFNPETNIAFSIPDNRKVKLEIINLLGQKVKILLNENLPAGHHVVTWDGRDELGFMAATGVYFYRLIAGEHTQSKKMVLLK